jgi:serine/threonine-protein kinase PknG
LPIQEGDRFCRKCGFNFVGSGLVTSSQLSTAHPHFANQDGLTAMEVREGMMLGENGKYRVTKMIGKGGMGAVFLAEDTVLKRQVVIKALLHSDDPDMVAASIKEREFLAMVKHPSIVSIYDFFTIGTEGYIVMEFVNGRTLYQIMDQQKQPFPPADAVRYMRDILPAFTYLHRLDLVYCDFKPQNVMVETLKDGSKALKLIDLGTVIKFEPDPEAVYGTTGFYAPEAIDHPSPQTDLYTVCRSLAWMVTWMDLSKPQYGMPPLEAFPIFKDNEPLYNLLYRGTHPEPKQRFASAEELYDQLDGVLRILEGGKRGVPVRSKLFASGSLYQTNRLDAEGYILPDEDDLAIDYIRQGDAAILRGDLQSAERIYNEAVGRHRDSEDAALRLAEVSIEQRKYGEAKAQIDAVSRRNPLSWKAKWLTGRLLEVQENLPAACQTYQDLVKYLPGELPPQLALARVLFAMNQPAQALASFNLVMRTDPDSNDAIFGACEAYLRLNNFESAVKVLEMVGENSSLYVEARLKICKILLYNKPNSGPAELAYASESLRRLKQLNIETPEFLMALAEFYRRVWELARERKMPAQFPLPHQPASNTPSATPHLRVLGRLAEDSYREYLRRVPNSPNREEILRSRFKVAPWRLF